MLEPVLSLALEESRGRDIVKIAGVCGQRQQALNEAQLAARLGYDAALLSLAELRDANIAELLEHSRSVAEVIPIIGFYLQPAVGGRLLPFEFWQQFIEIQNVVAIKIAPFNRYQTIDVLRAVAESGRAGQIALYTGNDDNILIDLLTQFNFGGTRVRIVGGLLGHWAVWTSIAVKQLAQIKMNSENAGIELLTLAAQITDANAAIFDPAHQFQGCIPGIHEILRRQGLLVGRWCLDANEELSPNQMKQIDRVYQTYPHLQDDQFVQEHLDDFLR